jgi:CubicO group peptidase (beta-lactamase class C family)
MNCHVLFVAILLLSLPVKNVVGQDRIDQKALNELVEACKRTHSTGLAIWYQGKSFKTYSFDSSNNMAGSYSAHKSLINLAIGKLVTDGQLQSIDSPVYRFFPEWKQGLKKNITIRHLLNHTSGLEYDQNDPDGWDRPELIQYALATSVVDTPGTRFLYNDRAVDILRGIIKKVTGKTMDQYIKEKFFIPLEIKNYNWVYDSAATPINLIINPAEFVKIGQLTLNSGQWNGKQVVSEGWIKESIAQAQPFVANCGLLWWRIPEKITYIVDEQLMQEFRNAGVSLGFIEQFRKLKGVYENVNITEEKLVAVFGNNWKGILNKELYPYYPRRAKWKMSDNYIGYKAEGWLGQYIVVYPGKQLVACRMIRQGKDYDPSRDEFTDFEKYVYSLIPR